MLLKHLLISGTLRFDPYCPSKDLIQISTRGSYFHGAQKFIQKFVSRTKWFGPCCPFKALKEISIYALIFSSKLGNFQLMLIYPLVLTIYLRIVSGTVWFDPYSPLQGFYQVLVKGSCFFLFQKSLRFKKFESQTI